MFFKKKVDKKLEKAGVNLDLIREIQPAGNIMFKDLHVKKGDGYEACIYVYDFPSQVNDFWLQNILNTSNSISVFDMSPAETIDIVKGINDSMKEQLDRAYHDKDTIEKMNAQNRYSELAETYNQISMGGEVIKNTNARIYVSGRTLEELQAKVKDELDNLETRGFKGTVLLNETKEEWQSMMLPYKEAVNLKNKRKGIGISAKTLAAGYPFYHTKLEDPYGTYLGTTTTGGNVLLDLFHRDDARRYYNGVLVGTMGAGKSTTLKKLTLDNILRGNLIRGIDVTGEFKQLVEETGGKNIALDGSAGIINPLQILRTAETENNSFMAHLSKLTTFFNFLSPDADVETRSEFELLAREFYIEIGLFDPDSDNEGLTSLPAKDYPTLSYFHKYIQYQLYEETTTADGKTTYKIRNHLSPQKAERLEKIELIIKNLVLNYPDLFDGISSIEDFTNEQIVFFSIRTLTSMKQEIFNAQMFSVLNLLWDNMLSNGEHYKRLFDKKQIDWRDVRRYLIVIDEAHRVINADNVLAVKFLTDFEREARKYFAGLLFVSQSIRDFVPEGSTEGLGAIKTLFELTQYKFIMQQDSNALGVLESVFNNTISATELNQIPNFKRGECLLSINGYSNITFAVEASPKEIDLFAGGA